jgi:hypothetical protein
LKADLSERDSNIIALEIELDGKVKEVDTLKAAPEAARRSRWRLY